jgi:hypothetical protein
MEPVRGAQKFAILLCGLRADTPVDRRPREFFEELFVNDSADGLNRYWRAASHETISLAGSRVFGWRELPQSLDAYRATSGRVDRIRIAAEHFASPGPDQVDFRTFDGIVVVTDQDVDLTAPRGRVGMTLNGETRAYRSVICSQANNHCDIAHEMGHSFGFDHAFSMNPMSCSPANDGRPGAYCDVWDVMGTPTSVTRPRFGRSGPLLNAGNMRLLGWLQNSRVRRFTGNSDSFQLRPLSRPDLSGALAVEFDSWIVEFRMNKGWDEGFNRPGVLIHRVADEVPPQITGDQHSVVLGFPAEFLVEGGTYAEGDPRFGPYRRVTVQDIDATNETATVSFLRKAREGLTDEIGILQWIVEGVIGVSPQGTLVKVPPRPPIRDMLVGIAVNQLTETLMDSPEKATLRRASLELIAETVKRELQS